MGQDAVWEGLTLSPHLSKIPHAVQVITHPVLSMPSDPHPTLLTPVPGRKAWTQALQSWLVGDRRLLGRAWQSGQDPYPCRLRAVLMGESQTPQKTAYVHNTTGCLELTT